MSLISIYFTKKQKETAKLFMDVFAIDHGHISKSVSLGFSSYKTTLPKELKPDQKKFMIQVCEKTSESMFEKNSDSLHSAVKLAQDPLKWIKVAKEKFKLTELQLNDALASAIEKVLEEEKVEA